MDLEQYRKITPRFPYPQQSQQGTEQQSAYQKTKARRMILKPVKGKEGLFYGYKSNGKPYTVRKDRHRYFFPNEWLNFIAQLREYDKMIFETLIQTGARIEECLNIKRKHYDFERNTLDLYVTKSKATKGQSKEVGGTRRGFSISTAYVKKVKHYINMNRINPDNYMFVRNLPKGFESWTREEKKKYLKGKQVAISQLLKRAVQRAGLIPWEFSLHNIRKTHGMWLKALIPYSREITEGEICMRLGHDMNTFLKHYGSPSIFNERDKNMMIIILGDIYGLK